MDKKEDIDLEEVGEWRIFKRNGMLTDLFFCSECDAVYNDITNFCPNCGSRDIEVYCGMFVDRYVCKKCGFESHN